jgi:hypothetical protein
MNEPVKSGISMLAGFGFGWLAIVVVPVLCWFVIMALAELLGESGTLFAILVQFLIALPLLALAGLAIGFLIKGHKRAAIGVAAAALSAVALTVLLVAACFGLFYAAH